MHEHAIVRLTRQTVVQAFMRLYKHSSIKIEHSYTKEQVNAIKTRQMTNSKILVHVLGKQAKNENRRHKSYSITNPNNIKR